MFGVCLRTLHPTLYRDGKKATNLMLSPLNRQPSEKEKAGRIPMRRASNRNVEVAPLATATLSPPHFATAAGGGEDEPVVDYWAFIATLAAVLHCEQRELPNRVERATQVRWRWAVLYPCVVALLFSSVSLCIHSTRWS